MSTLQAWKAEISDRGLAIGTNRNIYRELAALLNYAVRVGHLPKNPLSSVGNFRDVNFTSLADTLRYYTADQFLTFLSAARADASASGDW